MQPKTIIRNTAYVVGVLWSIALALNGLHLSSGWKKALSFIPLGLVACFTVYDHVLWRWRPLLPLARKPDIAGTWLGTYDAEWLDNAQQVQRSSGPAALVIKQSFTSTSIVLLAEKSKSYSTLSRVRPLESGDFAVDYLYDNSPHMQFRKELSVHNGSAELAVPSIRPTKFTGAYWTDRLSRGALDMRWVSRQRVSSLADAQALSVEPRKGAA